MTEKIVILIAMILFEVRANIIRWIQWKQYRKPLPAEVADIYDEKRYADFINYKKDSLLPRVIKGAVDFTISVVILFSPFYSWVEGIAGRNVYVICIVTLLVIQLITLLYDVPYRYYMSFVVDERYGMNRLTKKAFIKDYMLDTGETFLGSAALILLVALVSEKIGGWILRQNLSFKGVALAAAAIMGILIAFLYVITSISLLTLRMKYKFTDLEEGDLRAKIESLVKDSKKKLKAIKVYDESSKSNNKNAFLLRFLWIREFGIADNFINENSERELLAVLAHEAGHLKHKKDIFNYIGYVSIVAVVVIFALLVSNAEAVSSFAAYTRESFGLSCNNYYLLTIIAGYAIIPVSWITSLFSNWKSRREEKEADLNAVKEGYGEELIATFKRVSDDELIDVNPAPVIEFCEYSHPGMYQRIKYIREAMEAVS